MFNIRNTCISFIVALLVFSVSINETVVASAPQVKDFEIQTVIYIQPEAEQYWCGNEGGLLGFNTLDALENLILALGFKHHEVQSKPSVQLADKPVAKVVANQVPTGTSNHENNAKASIERNEPTTEVSRGGGRTITMVATGYTDAPEENYPWAGAPSYIGLPLARGIVAVDPNVIPMGSKLYIEGYGEGIAADQGGAIKGNRIDLFFDSKAEAYKWGMRTITVTVYP